MNDEQAFADPLRQWPDVMIDIETCGVTAAAAIIEVAVVYFDLVTGEIGPQWSSGVNLETNQKAGREINAETLIWWLVADDERNEHFRRLVNAEESLDEVLTRLQIDMNSSLEEGGRVWARGNLDCEALEHAFRSFPKDCHFICPWKYYQVRDQRSVLAWEGLKPEYRSEAAKHYALDDALAQVKDLLRAKDSRLAAAGLFLRPLHKTYVRSLAVQSWDVYRESTERIGRKAPTWLECEDGAQECFMAAVSHAVAIDRKKRSELIEEFQREETGA